MSAELETLLEKVDELSLEELVLLQNRIARQLQSRTLAELSNQQKLYEQEVFYRPSKEQVRLELAEIFTAEELAEIAQIDPATLPELAKPLSEAINEDREDRF